jgi:hypothetical protein
VDYADPMLMVIFGAGASYDSANPDEYGRHMPLAKDLIAPAYNPVAAHYPASRAVIGHVRRQINDDSAVSLERALATFEGNAANSFERQAQLVAFRFYLRELISSQTQNCLSATNGYTYYLDLFNRLHDWQRQSGEPVRIVTFNYDTLIEDALETVVTGWRFTSQADYLKRQDWKLMKLHGSVTWCRMVEQPLGNDLTNLEQAMELANNWRFESEDILPFRMWTTENLDVAPDEVRVPALAVPMENKTRFECPHAHVDAVWKCMPEVHRLIICGWRAAERHAVELLNAVNPGYYLGVVAGSERDVNETITNLDMVGRKGVPHLGIASGMTALASDMSQLNALIEKPW